MSTSNNSTKGEKDEYGIPRILDGETKGKAAARRVKFKRKIKAWLDDGGDLETIQQQLGLIQVVDEEAEPENEMPDEIDILVFRLGREKFAVTLEYIETIVPITEITVVPHTKPFVLGLVNIRGYVSVLLDLANRFQLSSETMPEKGYIMKFKHRKYSASALLEELPYSMKLKTNTIDHSVSGLKTGAEQNNYLDGVIRIEEELIGMVNIERLLASESLIDMNESLLF